MSKHSEPSQVVPLYDFYHLSQDIKERYAKELDGILVGTMRGEKNIKGDILKHLVLVAFTSGYKAAQLEK